jgi:hypothetical protein
MLKALPAIFQNSQPLKLAGMPIDIANGVAWLSSDAARFVTGQALVIDGGISLHSAGIIGDGQGGATPASPEERRAAFARAMGLANA